MTEHLATELAEARARRRAGLWMMVLLGVPIVAVAIGVLGLILEVL